MPVKFTNALVVDTNPCVTLEDVYRQFSALGGVHRTAFDSLINEDAFDASEWIVASGSWTFGDTLEALGDGEAPYNICWWKQNLPASYVADIELEEGVTHIAVVVSGNRSDQGYVIDLTGSVATILRLSETKLSEFDFSGQCSLSGPGTLRVAVRDTYLSEDEADHWLLISAWLDDMFLLATAEHVEGQTLPRGFGIATKAGLTTRISSIRVPDLTDIIPTASVDPNETPMQAIQRAVHDRVIQSYIRQDGTLRAWRSKPTPVDQTFGPAHESFLSYEHNEDDLPSHVRLFYALSWVDVYSEALYEQFGHRFQELTSGVIENENDAVAEAMAILRRAQENARRVDFTTYAGGALLQPGDHVALPDGEEYIVDAIDLSYDRQTVKVNIKGRHYVFTD